MPYIHLGTDKVDLGAGDGTEWVPPEWIAEWAARVAANGRTLLGLCPGELMETEGPLFAAVTTHADAFWNGPGTADFAADLERRILAQRDKVLTQKSDTLHLVQ
jgi:hypothetical protein